MSLVPLCSDANKQCPLRGQICLKSWYPAPQHQLKANDTQMQECENQHCHFQVTSTAHLGSSRHCLKSHLASFPLQSPYLDTASKQITVQWCLAQACFWVPHRSNRSSCLARTWFRADPQSILTTIIILLGTCIAQLSHYWDKVPDKSNLKKWFIWLTVSEVPSHGLLVPRQKHYGAKGLTEVSCAIPVLRGPESRGRAKEKRYPAGGSCMTLVT